MFSTELIVALAIGMVAMVVMIAYQMKWYHVAPWKSIVVAVTLALTGLYGSELWFFIENQSFGGRSFYGAIFFTPLTFLLVAWLCRIPYLYSLDFCAPAGCLMLSLIKVDCMVSQCCEGMILDKTADGVAVRFPSQMVEMADFLILGILLFLLARAPKRRGKLFPLFLILYGSNRFVLNLLRDEMAQTEHWLPIGNLWSAIAVVAGVLWLMILHNRDLDRQLATIRQQKEPSAEEE